jgi:hypothetical protein
MTLLELMLATAMLTTVLTAVSVLVRGTYNVWNAHEGDLERIEALHAAVRHLVRNMRQASSVAAITAKTNTAGSLSLVMTNGQTWVWSRNSGTNQVLFGVTTATNLLAENITELSFTAYEADGTTETTTVADIQLIKVTAKTVLPRDANTNRTVTCFGWVRAW